MVILIFFFKQYNSYFTCLMPGPDKLKRVNKTDVLLNVILFYLIFMIRYDIFMIAFYQLLNEG